jgi:hypothetical protein
MSHEAQLAVAANFLFLAALHHLAIAVIAALFWIRRRSMERTVAVYMAIAFATATAALTVHPPARAHAPFAAGLALLWVLEAVHIRNVLSFRQTPRLRLWLMAAAAVFAFMYPGYSGELPSFVFSPIGVTLPPTLLLALAVMNTAAPRTNRVVHWPLAVVGLAVGGVGLYAEGWVHAPLVAAALYAVPLLMGRARLEEDPGEADTTSVRAVHDRIHKRRVLMSKPRRSSVRKLDIRDRRKR